MDLKQLNQRITNKRIELLINNVTNRRGRGSLYPISIRYFGLNTLFRQVYSLIQSFNIDKKHLKRIHTNPLFYYSLIENQLNQQYIKELKREKTIDPKQNKILFRYNFELQGLKSLNFKKYKMFNPKYGNSYISWVKYKRDYLDLNVVRSKEEILRWRIEPFGYVIRFRDLYFYVIAQNSTVRFTNDIIYSAIKEILKNKLKSKFYILKGFGLSYVIVSKKKNLTPSQPIITLKRLNINKREILKELQNYVKRKFKGERNIKKIIKEMDILRGRRRIKYVFTI
jgi:hypothetical protein